MGRSPERDFVEFGVFDRENVCLVIHFSTNQIQIKLNYEKNRITKTRIIPL